MKKDRPLLFTRVRILLLIVLIAVAAIIGSSYVIVHRWNHQEDVDKLVINVFGKQRMLTQLTAKDATHLYALSSPRRRGQPIRQMMSFVPRSFRPRTA